MHIREYLFHNELKVKDFAKKLGCSREYVTLIKHKKKIPGRFLAQQIERITNGMVTVEEILHPDQSK